MARFLFILLAAVLALTAAVPAHAQQSTQQPTTQSTQRPTLNVPSIEARSVLSDPDHPDAALNMRVAMLFRDELRMRGIPHEGPGLDVRFLAQTHTTPAGTVVLLSLVEGRTLSEPVLDAAAKHEILYAGRALPENAEEGKFVREYMTREVLEGHVQVVNIVQHIVAEAELPTVVSAYLDTLTRRQR